MKEMPHRLLFNFVFFAIFAFRFFFFFFVHYVTNKIFSVITIMADTPLETTTVRICIYSSVVSHAFFFFFF